MIEQTTAKKQLKEEMAEEYLTANYSFQFNLIKGIPEYRKRGERKFKALDDYMLNSLKRELYNKVGIVIGTGNLKEILSSDFSKKVDPYQAYFKHLETWDYLDHIGELASTVKVVNPEKWKVYLRRWLIATVANALTDQNCQNHTCLTLTGGQGKFKTTWLDNLCPPDLFDYLYTGKIDPNNKDSQALLAECILINIDDQLRQLNKKDENDLKELITKPFIKYRRPYDKYITTYHRRASFMASVNGNDFLTDPSGSRRFLPFEVVNIDIDKAKNIDINKVWSQAYFFFKENERYWFNDQEIIDLTSENQEFQVISIEEQMILEYFARPTASRPATHYLQPAAILGILEQHTHTRLSLKKLGEALTKLGFIKTRKVINSMGQYVYHVIRLNMDTIENERARADENQHNETHEQTPF